MLVKEKARPHKRLALRMKHIFPIGHPIELNRGQALRGQIVQSTLKPFVFEPDRQTTVGRKLPWNGYQQHRDLLLLEASLSLHHPVDRMKDGDPITLFDHLGLLNGPIDRKPAGRLQWWQLNRKGLFVQPTLLFAAALIVLAFTLNLPLGYLRVRSPKFSVRWFICIHLSIPMIVLTRDALGFGWELVPFTLTSAIIGQMLGARFRPPVESR